MTRMAATDAVVVDLGNIVPAMSGWWAKATPHWASKDDPSEHPARWWVLELYLGDRKRAANQYVPNEGWAYSIALLRMVEFAVGTRYAVELCDRIVKHTVAEWDSRLIDEELT